MELALDNVDECADARRVLYSSAADCLQLVVHLQPPRQFKIMRLHNRWCMAVCP